jgi:hypothetical protein
MFLPHFSVLSKQFATQGSPTLNREHVVVLMGEIPQVMSDKNEELNEKYFIILIKKTVIKHSQLSVRTHPNMYITQTQE